MSYKYQSSMPDYMRIDPNILEKGSSKPERVYILSK
jgi:hypothetical protein